MLPLSFKSDEIVLLFTYPISFLKRFDWKNALLPLVEFFLADYYSGEVVFFLLEPRANIEFTVLSCFEMRFEDGELLSL